MEVQAKEAKTQVIKEKEKSEGKGNFPQEPSPVPQRRVIDEHVVLTTRPTPPPSAATAPSRRSVWCEEVRGAQEDEWNISGCYTPHQRLGRSSADKR